MSRLIRWVFPIALAAAWVITSGYALSRLASLHGTLVQRGAVAQPASGGEDATGVDGGGPVADLDLARGP